MKTKLVVNTSDYLSNGYRICDYLVAFDVYENDGQYLDDVKFYANLTGLIYSGVNGNSDLNIDDFKQICIANGVNILLGKDRSLNRDVLELIEFNPDRDVLVFYLGNVLGKRNKELFIKDGIFFDKYNL